MKLLDIIPTKASAIGAEILSDICIFIAAFAVSTGACVQHQVTCGRPEATAASTVQAPVSP